LVTKGENIKGLPMDTHWFAPLPPEPVENEEAVKVSPPDGTRGVTVTRSVLREPIMVMIIGDILKPGGGIEGGERRLR
jgi:hypothetical protein